MLKKHNNFFRSPKLLLFAILLIAAVFRLWNVNWDKGFHLHPDERFLVMVDTTMKMPTSFSQYLSPDTSPFNPPNIGYKFYVYGTLPLVINKLLAQVFPTNDYNGLLYQGRILSAFFDLLTMFILFKILSLIKKHRNIPTATVYLGTFFYAIAVLPIQLSHYFAVDTFLSFFMMASFYFILTFYYEQKLYNIFLGGISVGLALASKVSAIYIIPLLLFFLFLTTIKKRSPLTQYAKDLLQRISIKNKKVIFLGSLLLSFTIFFVSLYIILRLADPYYFADQNFFHLKGNPTFLENIKILKSFENPEGWFPPAVQWLHKSAFFSLYQLALFGVGVAYFIFMLLGTFFLIKKHKHSELLVTFGWVLFFFIYQSIQFSKTMRYLIFLYPFFAILAAFGFHYALGHAKKLIKTLFILLILFWPLCFLSIYIQPMSRIAASYWIYYNIPAGTLLLNEHWDDALPLPVIPEKKHAIELLPVFDPDTAEKWQKMNELLKRGDYLILSSGRSWSNVPTAPERYPLMTQFYKDLFAGKLAYKKVAEFTSYPSLSYLGIPITIPDDIADESFTVYDHPKVMIFKKMQPYE